jgi:hypothetical protein
MLTEDQKMDMILQLQDIETEIVNGDIERIMRELLATVHYLQQIKEKQNG